ncbi:DUF5348 domain-containing protein [Aquibacillus sp. 3ASR75-11]|uniref:DUF5348 domain-containing protein n=1 Tax=Terrihalobacillus insolitus TaxID=2950438 RepID=A0A9X3WZZ3_9BACI|nr:DUF5348 domain-containing protein [Terrihalobacillus insolitus]MDC3413802.1 DUF5348 domain-containing protein [Terrihalobacillus insolitus]MDC3426394.1 DUF5348 domain-containing protein [Terrihalobacillus insolitus]
MNADMIYDNNRECWMMERNGRTFNLHCGECFELIIGNSKMPCRLELDNQWYVIIHESRFNLRVREVYKIVI